MKGTPPHLPPRHSNEFLKQRRQSLGWLILFIVLSLMASIAASLATLAWIAPPYAQSSLYTLYTQTATSERNTGRSLDSIISQQIDQRIVEIYETRNTLGEKFYANDALVGQALLLSSDGWAVMYAPVAPLRLGTLEAVNHQGVSFPISNMVIDDETGLIYVKITGEGFRSDITFQDWRSFSSETSVWAVRSGQQKSVRLRETLPDTSGEVALSELTASYVLVESDERVTGDVFVNEQGQLVGIASEDAIIPGWQISSQMKTIFESTTLAYPEVPWRGRVLTSIESDGILKNFSGFYVTQSPTRATTSTLGVGDVITKIDGEAFNSASAQRQIRLARDQRMEVTILRRDKEMTVMIPLK